MKKKIISVISVLFILFIAGIIFLICFCDYTPLSLVARAYTGNRIVVNIHTTVDGKSVYVYKNDDLKSAEEEYIENANDISTISNKENYNVLKCLTYGYGPHDFYLLIDNKYPIVINMYQYNWWDIQRSDLYIDIDTKNDTMTYYYEHTSLQENGKKQKNKKDEVTVSDVNSINYIWVGE